MSPKRSNLNPKPKASQDKNMIEVEVSSLKQRLNSLYQNKRHFDRSYLSHDGLFEYLWDLKEMALIEGRESVEIPEAWVRDLDSKLIYSPKTH